MADSSAVLTLDKLKAVMRELDVERDARDLDLFLSDDWNAYRMLRDGGRLVEIQGQQYVVDRSFFEWPQFPFFEWKP